MLLLVILFISGISLGMHDKPSAENAFDSVQHIVRDAQLG
ncbi:MAG: hypothetical protein AAGB04_13855 [Pseudomonadota bacterium]